MIFVIATGIFFILKIENFILCSYWFMHGNVNNYFNNLVVEKEVSSQLYKKPFSFTAIQCNILQSMTGTSLIVSVQTK